MRQAIESEDLNNILQELHDQGMKIIDIKLWQTDRPVSKGQLGFDRIVYDIMYEESYVK